MSQFSLVEWSYLRTLSANLTSPNHNNIHSHVVSHGLFRSDDVGSRWLLPCLLFHIIFLTTLIASPLFLFLQCLVSSSHHLITAARSIVSLSHDHHFKIHCSSSSYHHNKAMIRIQDLLSPQQDDGPPTTWLALSAYFRFCSSSPFFARPQDATSTPRTFKL